MNGVVFWVFVCDGIGEERESNEDYGGRGIGDRDGMGSEECMVEDVEGEGRDGRSGRRSKRN